MRNSVLSNLENPIGMIYNHIFYIWPVSVAILNATMIFRHNDFHYAGYAIFVCLISAFMLWCNLPNNKFIKEKIKNEKNNKK
jgi:hypothetical protein